MFFRFPSSKAQTEGHRKTMLFTWESAAVARVFNVEHSPRRFAEEKQTAKQKKEKNALRISSVDHHRAKRKTLSTLNHQSA